MSTRFYRGTRSASVRRRVSNGVLRRAEHRSGPLILGDWVVDKLGYKGDVFEAEVRIETTAGQLFGAPKRTQAVC